MTLEAIHAKCMNKLQNAMNVTVTDINDMITVKDLYKRDAYTMGLYLDFMTARSIRTSSDSFYTNSSDKKTVMDADRYWHRLEAYAKVIADSYIGTVFGQ